MYSLLHVASPVKESSSMTRLYHHQLYLLGREEHFKHAQPRVIPSLDYLGWTATRSISSQFAGIFPENQI